jgi:DNA-binding IclR family transcriptional regulator
MSSSEFSEDTSSANEETDTDRNFVVAAARGLEILSCFTGGIDSLGNQDIADITKLPKSTVARLTYTLVKLGYLSKDPASSRYRLGIATLALGSALLGKLDVRRIARPFMLNLSQRTNAVVALAVRDREAMLYVDISRGDSALTVSADVGSRLPLLRSAAGRAWLAAASLEERKQAWHDICAKGDAPDADRDDVLAEVDKEYEQYGVACSMGNWRSEVNGIARAVFPGRGQQHIVINCGGPAFQFSPEYLIDTARPLLIDAVASIQSLCTD